MSLSDLMGHAGLQVYAEVALIIFFLVFLLVMLRVLAPSRRHRSDLDEASRLPLEDGTRDTGQGVNR